MRFREKESPFETGQSKNLLKLRRIRKNGIQLPYWTILFMLLKRNMFEMGLLYNRVRGIEIFQGINK